MLEIVNFQVINFAWNPDGKSMVLMDKDKFCLAFPIDEPNQIPYSIINSPNI